MFKNTKSNCWLFDIDGVLTNPQKKIIPAALLFELSKIIDSGQPVAFVTGRSVAWVRERVIDKLSNNKPKNIFISAEKGGVWSRCNGQQWTLDIDENLAPPQKLIAKVEKLVKEKFDGTMFLDPKHTMVSIEVKDGTPLQRFSPLQKQLDWYLRSFLKEAGLEDQFKIDSGIIATDVQNTQSGKRLGANRVFDWLGERNLKPKHFFAFGDTHGDVNIARTVFEKGHEVEFVFTGKKNLLPVKKLPFPTTVFDGEYSQGTLKYLTKLSPHSQSPILIS